MGNQRIPSKISTVVTASTDNWVSAKSGAENQAKVITVAKPATLIKASEVKRWYLACTAAPTAAPKPTSHNRAKVGENGNALRSPLKSQTRGSVKRNVAKAANKVTSTSSNICGCKRRVLSKRSSLRLATVSMTSSPSKKRLPLTRPSKGVRVMRPSP